MADNKVVIHLKDTREGPVVENVVLRYGLSCIQIPVLGIGGSLGAGEVLDLAELHKQLPFQVEVTDKAF